jgi:hypothetical protein
VAAFAEAPECAARSIGLQVFLAFAAVGTLLCVLAGSWALGEYLGLGAPAGRVVVAVAELLGEAVIALYVTSLALTALPTRWRTGGSG